MNVLIFLFKSNIVFILINMFFIILLLLLLLLLFSYYYLLFHLLIIVIIIIIIVIIFLFFFFLLLVLLLLKLLFEIIIIWDYYFKNNFFCNPYYFKQYCIGHQQTTPLSLVSGFLSLCGNIQSKTKLKGWTRNYQWKVAHTHVLYKLARWQTSQPNAYIKIILIRTGCTWLVSGSPCTSLDGTCFIQRPQLGPVIHSAYLVSLRSIPVRKQLGVPFHSHISYIDI